MARATGNERLTLALAQTLSEMERLFPFGLAMRNRTAEMREEHQALIDALARGDADEAERVTREELESSKAMVIGGSCRAIAAHVSISGAQARIARATAT